jgi:hypothetical protein
LRKHGYKEKIEMYVKKRWGGVLTLPHGKGAIVMDNLETKIHEDVILKVVNKKRPKVIVVVCFFLVLSLVGNAFLGLSWYKYINAYNALQKDYKQRETSLLTSNRQLKQVNENKKVLEETLNEAYELLTQYDSAYKELVEQDATSRIPKGYYMNSGSGGNKLFDDLKDFLNYDFSLPKNYTLGIFDCSESAAYLEYMLQNNGFDAKIAVGNDPAGSGAYHAWVLVNTKEGAVAIEPTVLTGGVQRLLESLSNIMNNSARGVIYYTTNDETAINYYEAYDSVFEDITEAVKNYQGIDEWNWWEGSWGFE